jgi:glycosyltransferase involved in cell wall biosynthesis
MIIGTESNILHRRMTGIANYTFHTIHFVLELERSLKFVAFRDLEWNKLDLLKLQRIARTKGSQPAQNNLMLSRRNLISRRIVDVASRAAGGLSKLQSTRNLYRKIRRAAFVKSIDAQQLDLFHAFNFQPPSDPGVPVLPVIYDLSTFRHPEFHPADRVRWLSSLGDTVTRAPMVQTISEFSKREIVSVFNYPADRIFVASPAAASVFEPHGFEATRDDLALLGLKYGKFFLSVGTLEPRKNIRTLISAYSHLSAVDREHFPLVVVGGKGWGDLNLPRQAEAFRREGTLRFVEDATNPQLRSLYEGTRLFLMPSLYEGFGMPVVEALACGAPVAHSSGTSMDEISGDLGRRVPAYDVDGWTEIFRQAMGSDDYADEKLRAARIVQAGHFDWHESARRVLAAYRQLIPA